MKFTAIAALAALISTASFASDTVDFDGCAGKLVPGTNYYNLVDPNCKTISSQYESTEKETERRLAEEAAKDE